MAEPVVIAAEPRTVLGKRVRHLRREGHLPANVYGKGLESVAIQINHREFLRTLKSTGFRSMFELSINGEPSNRYVIVRSMARIGGTGEPIHVDFFQVDPNEPIHANVPIRLVGQAPAVRDLAGTLLQSLEILSVRCLPLDIPEAIEADVAMLKRFEDTMTVDDITAPEGVEILTDPSVPIASVAPPRIRLEEGAEAE
ncbi:MAG: 50S ribosomal protein L25, partial [Dehalococcoidia bacterium]|nr:50S ribosomal protein L25 [Dehalococcoidia bacterium]